VKGLGIALLALGTGAAGFLLGMRVPPHATLREGVAPRAPASVAAPPERPGEAPAPVGSSECGTLKTQLALCMAYHPPSSDTERELAMCRGDLDLYKNEPTWPDCYTFMDLAPIYDRELGEIEPSPETLERAKHVDIDQCMQVLTWAERARRQQRSCLKGPKPPTFAERYGRPIDERPLFKACLALGRPAVFNAWVERDEARIREMGGRPGGRLRLLPDGGMTAEPGWMRREVDDAGVVQWYPPALVPKQDPEAQP
jgi:hypothetical protein